MGSDLQGGGQGGDWLLVAVTAVVTAAQSAVPTAWEVPEDQSDFLMALSHAPPQASPSIIGDLISADLSISGSRKHAPCEKMESCVSELRQIHDAKQHECERNSGGRCHAP